MSKKDAYWFKHDSTAGRGLRLRKIQHIYTHWGKGVYWDVIEILRDQSGYKFEKDDSSLQMLCDLIGCKDEKKFMSWFNDCIKLDVFLTDEKYFYSEVLIENMTKWETKKANGSTPKKKTGSETEAKRKRNTKRNGSIREYKIIEDKNIYRKFKHLKISIPEFEKIKETYTKEQIDNILDSIENYAKNKNYTSLYLTAIKWLQKEHPSNSIKCPYNENQIRLAKSQMQSGGGLPEWFDAKYKDLIEID